MVLCSASFVAVVDTTIVSIALPSVRAALAMSAPDAQWVLNAYALAFGGCLLVFGRIADLTGRRRALLTTLFAEPAERGRAIGAYGAMAALGFVVGMAGGGVITELLGWRWVFLVNLPVAAAMLVPSWRWLAESRDRSGERAWRAVRAGARPVLTSNLAIALQSMVGIAWLYLLTLHLQEVRGHTALEAGLLFAPMTLASVIAAPSAGRYVDKLGIRRTGVAGLGTVAAGVVLMIAGLGLGGPPVLVVAG